MRVFVSAVAVASVIALTACGSGTKGNGSGNSAASTPTTSAAATDTAMAPGSTAAAPTLTGQAANGPLCTRLAAVSQQFGSVSSAMTDPQSAATALKAFVAELKQVGSGAPADVESAVNDLISAATQAAAALANPSTFDASKLQQLAPKLAADAQTIGAYVASACSTG